MMDRLEPRVEVRAGFAAHLDQAVSHPRPGLRVLAHQERGNVEEEVRGFADDLFRLASDRLVEIDGLIGKHTQHWRMDRMATVDRNVLRGAVAEFLGYPATPHAVVINEALEIARKFSTPESVQFINGVLDSVGKEVGP